MARKAEALQGHLARHVGRDLRLARLGVRGRGEQQQEMLNSLESQVADMAARLEKHDDLMQRMDDTLSRVDYVLCTGGTANGAASPSKLESAGLGDQHEHFLQQQEQLLPPIQILYIFLVVLVLYQVGQPLLRLGIIVLGLK